MLECGKIVCGFEVFRPSGEKSHHGNFDFLEIFLIFRKFPITLLENCLKTVQSTYTLYSLRTTKFDLENISFPKITFDLLGCSQRPAARCKAEIKPVPTRCWTLRTTQQIKSYLRKTDISRSKLGVLKLYRVLVLCTVFKQFSSKLFPGEVLYFYR